MGRAHVPTLQNLVAPCQGSSLASPRSICETPPHPCGLSAGFTSRTYMRTLGSTPALLAVPGNHDLVRPSPSRPAARVLADWVAQKDAQAEFWRDPASPYRDLVDQAFANFTDWNRVHPLCSVPRKSGMLPGDFSAVIEKDGLRLGVVGLNSSFLQLSDGDFEGKLTLDVHQFHAVCDGDGPAWINGCDFALLMTHHPPEWLSPEARDHFFSEIAPPGRFAAHLFGHLHEHMVTTLSIGGSAPRRQIQGSSLFGLEGFGDVRDGTTARRHGYAACRIEVDDQGTATLKMWPRVAKKHRAQYWRIVQDLDGFELGDDQATTPEPLLRPQRKTVTRLPHAPDSLLSDLVDSLRAPGDDRSHCPQPTRPSESGHWMVISRNPTSIDLRGGGKIELTRGPNFLAPNLTYWKGLPSRFAKFKEVYAGEGSRVRISGRQPLISEEELAKACKLPPSSAFFWCELVRVEQLWAEDSEGERLRARILESVKAAQMLDRATSMQIGMLYDLVVASGARDGGIVRAIEDEVGDVWLSF